MACFISGLTVVRRDRVFDSLGPHKRYKYWRCIMPYVIAYKDIEESKDPFYLIEVENARDKLANMFKSHMILPTNPFEVIQLFGLTTKMEEATIYPDDSLDLVEFIADSVTDYWVSQGFITKTITVQSVSLPASHNYIAIE